MIFTRRELFALAAALRYAQANVDDLNDSYANYTEADEDNASETVLVDGRVDNAFTADEFRALAARAAGWQGS